MNTVAEEILRKTEPKKVQGLSRLYPLKFHPVQDQLKKSDKRFITVPAGRRSGKTELAKRKLIKACITEAGYVDANFGAAAPTRDQAKAIYWEDLKRMTPPELLRAKPRESDLAIPFITGATLYVIGMDKPERVEGKPWNGLVLDEYGNMKASAWGENVRPSLSDRRGWAWIIGVPEGRNHYYDLNQYALSGIDPEWASFTWKSSDILPAVEIAAAKRQLDKLTYQQEYEASFINFTGRAYYSFTSHTHCKPLRYDPRAPLVFCFDFNSSPGVAAVAQEQYLPGQYERDINGLVNLARPVYGTGVIGEVYIPQNSTTPAVCRRLIQDWDNHQGKILCYGDATGGSGGSAKVSGSDWDLIKAELRPVFKDQLEFKVGKSNPLERVRVNAMNTRLMTGDDVIRMMIDPRRAPNVIRDFEGVRTLEGGSGEIDKATDKRLTHLTDGLGYYIAKEFPITKRVASVQPHPVTQ